MLEHSQFEELCAIAAVGQVSEDELSELRDHLAQCESCSNMQADFVEISSIWLPQAAEGHAAVHDSAATLSQKVLHRLHRAGANFSDAVLQEIEPKPRRSKWFTFPAWSLAPQAWATASLAAIVALSLGIWAGTKLPTKPETPSVNSATVSIPQATPDPISKPDDGQQSDLRGKLAIAEAERTRSLTEIDTLTRQISDLNAARTKDATEIAQLNTRLNESREIAARAETQFQDLKRAQDSKDAELVASQYKVREMENKIAEGAAAAERERQLTELASGSALRDVIASRNLHIVDVADVDRSGVRKPFGRVFYTEGKSLIFYAYDLTNPKGKQAFYAWGHKTGDPNSTKALGALVNDDQAQSRWVFKYADKKVLASIDTIYVTLEPTNSPGNKPHGKKLMNAYLGTAPNHP